MKDEGASIKLSFQDTGSGIAPDFVRHRIFEPFSQENPQNEGTGLGLSLVQHAANALDGEVKIKSDYANGSTFTVRFPRRRLIYHPAENSEETIPNHVTVDPVERPKLELSLFSTGRWQTGDALRDSCCTDMVSQSFRKNTSLWFTTQIIPWKASSTSTRLLLVFVEDLDLALTAGDDALDHSKLLVLCPKRENIICPRIPCSENSTAAFGPLTPSTLQNALAHLYPNIVPSSETTDPRSLPGSTSHQYTTQEGTSSDTSTTFEISNPLLGMADLELETSPQRGFDQLAHVSSARSNRQSTLPPGTSQASALDRLAQSTASPRAVTHGVPSIAAPDPRLLLVDDNSINLKVISMFAGKASSIPSTSVSSGREAILTFTEARIKQPYDLIFLDLSMPEISGFEVAKEIRELEASADDGKRTYICALTALVSADDRHRAFAAGVDEYVVKPAKFGDLKDVIDRWREKALN